ncbi:sodium:solute symporter family protein [Bacillus sp. JJ1521]|uniref:sodium:solute symporter family protein n=1 Tax=Bacillus sp. JJ1521 TaxID=3122957 RepID=UPI00300099CD
MQTNYIFVGVLLVVLLYVAYQSSRRIKTYNDFNLAGRNTGLFALVCTLGAAEFNTATLIGGASVAYLYGTVGIWYTSLIFIPVFGIYALTVAKRYSRLKISTIAEFFDKRYQGKNSELLRGIATFVTLSFTWIAPATYLAGLSVIGNVLLGIHPLWIVIGLTTICLFVSLSGGLLTAIWADIISYIMILIGMPILFFIGWKAAGGFSSLPSVFEPQYLSFEPIWDLESFGFAAVLTWCLQNILLYVAAPWYGQRIFSAKSEKVAYRGMIINTILITLLYGLVAVATMFSRVVMPNLDKSEVALPTLILNYTSPFLQGFLLVTLILVGVSTMIAIWNSAVSIVINDLYKRYLAKNKSEKHYIMSSRICFIILGISTIVFALTFVGNILLALTYISVFTALLAFPILAGFYWKRFNTSSALWSLIVGVVYVTIALLNSFPYHLISPIGVLLSVIVGTIIAFTSKQESTELYIKEFYNVVGSPLIGNKIPIVKDDSFTKVN